MYFCLFFFLFHHHLFFIFFPSNIRPIHKAILGFRHNNSFTYFCAICMYINVRCFNFPMKQKRFSYNSHFLPSKLCTFTFTHAQPETVILCMRSLYNPPYIPDNSSSSHTHTQASVSPTIFNPHLRHIKLLQQSF